MMDAKILWLIRFIAVFPWFMSPAALGAVALAEDGSWVSVLETPTYTLVMDWQCDDGRPGCTNIAFHAHNKKTGESFSRSGTRYRTGCDDAVTPCHVSDYRFQYKERVFRLHPDGTLTKDKLRTRVLTEQGKWRWSARDGRDNGRKRHLSSHAASGRWSSVGWSSVPLGPLRAVQDVVAGPDGLLYALTELGPRIEDPGILTEFGLTSVIKWNGRQWQPTATIIPGAVYDGPMHDIEAIAVYDSGAGPAIHAMANFYDGDRLYQLTRWGWQRLGHMLSMAEVIMTAAHLGGADVLVVAPGPGSVRHHDSPRIWNGHSWSGVEGVTNTVALLAGANAVYSAATRGPHVVKFDAEHNAAVGNAPDCDVMALAGSADGETIYAACSIPVGENKVKGCVYQWDGQSWHEITCDANGWMDTLAVLDGKLYVGGHFTSIGGLDAKGVAVWDGSEWAALGEGVEAVDDHIEVMYAHEGSLYVGGMLISVDGRRLGNLVKWIPK